MDAARELFYSEGIHTVGIDRVIERADVAKATLYSCFGSKDSLVRAYLEDEFERRKQRITVGLTRFATPRTKLLGIFDVLADYAEARNYRGCAFYNALAESEPGSDAEQVSNRNRAWTRELFTGLAREAGVADPESLAAQLVVLYDGGHAGSRVERSRRPIGTAKTMATALVDAALAA